MILIMMKYEARTIVLALPPEASDVSKKEYRMSCISMIVFYFHVMVVGKVKFCATRVCRCYRVVNQDSTLEYRLLLWFLDKWWATG